MGLPPKRKRIVAKGGLFSVPADLNKLAHKIGQSTQSKGKTTVVFLTPFIVDDLN